MRKPFVGRNPDQFFFDFEIIKENRDVAGAQDLIQEIIDSGGEAEFADLILEIEDYVADMSFDEDYEVPTACFSY